MQIRLPGCACIATSVRCALEALYHATDGPNWSNSDGWFSDAPTGDWYGITTYEGRVREIDLANNGLAGQLPNEIAQLTRLNVIDLRWNELGGPIPDVISNVGSLVKLYLGSNDFTGSIPSSLGYLPYLTELDLSYNRLSGSIPEEFGHLSELVGLGLQNNGLVWVDPSSLPDGLPLDQLESVVERINQQLIETGERIKTVDDFNRMIEVYGSGSVELEEGQNQRELIGLNGSRVPWSTLGSMPALFNAAIPRMLRSVNI